MSVCSHQYGPKRVPEHRHLQSQRGFSIIELLVVLAVLGVLANIALAAFSDIKKKVYNARAMQEMRSMERLIAGYSVENGGLPASLAQLQQGQFLDPWRRPYVYVRLSDGGPPRKDMAVVRLNTDYDLYSKGADGLSSQLLSNPTSLDDIVRGGDGAFMGVAAAY